MNICKNYHSANSVNDALQALARAPESARILAGGTDLLLDLQQGRHPPVDTLVDITNIPELNVLELRPPHLFIGAAVPHNVIVGSGLARKHSQALVEACGLIGGPQVRNVATLGGNVAHALPAADGTIALVALDAKAEIATQGGRRTVPLVELFEGPGQSTLDPQKELIVGFLLPTQVENQASAFKRLMRPQGVAIALLNCAVWLTRENEAIQDIRISIGPSGPVPRRMMAAEDFLRGKSPTEEILEETHQIILKQASFRTSRHRATLEYRQEMAGVLLRDTLRLAWERASLLVDIL
jgi:carbon-monoxide dehydrogenase medium subunit